MVKAGITQRFLKGEPSRNLPRKALKTILLIFVMTVTISNLSNATVFTIYNSSVLAEPQPPPLILLSSGTAGVTSYINSNGTWANITVKASTSYTEITKNGGFDTSPNNWLYGYAIYSGQATVAATWNQTYSVAPGASGIILLYMRLYNPTAIFNKVNGSIYLIQNVTMPNTQIDSIVLNVTYYAVYSTSFASLSSYYIYAELLYPNGSIVWSAKQTVSLRTWTNATFLIPNTTVIPGKTYTLLVGIITSGITVNIFGYTGNITAYQFFDSIRLYVKPLYPSFSGSILNINVTKGTYGTSLKVIDLKILAGTNVNASIYIANLSGGVSTPITISEGALTSGTTSNIPLTIPPLGYTSGYIHLSTSIYPSTIVNIPLELTYRTGGVTVTYRVNITIVDPAPSTGHRHQYSVRHDSQRLSNDLLTKELKRLSSILLGMIKGKGYGELIPLQRWRG